MPSPADLAQHRACLEFADAVALTTRRQFAPAMQKFAAAHAALFALYRDPAHPDLAHVALFRTVALLAAGQGAGAAGPAEALAARGMIKAWEGCKVSGLGTEAYHRSGGLTPPALAHYRQAVAAFAEAIDLLEAGLGADDPELYGPLGDYSGLLRAIGREADADLAYDRAIALPPKALSPTMIGGGYPIIALDPFGTNPLLPSQTP